MSAPPPTIFSFRLLGLIIVTILNLQNGNIWCSANKTTTCGFFKCKSLGDYYRKNMNQKGNPCTNFYDYVCRNWEKSNPRPKYEEHWNVDKLMQSQIVGLLRGILEDATPSSDAAVRRARDAYDFCMRIPFMGRFEPDKLRPLMRNIQEWQLFYPNDSAKNLTLPWELDNYYLKLTGESAFFDIMPDGDRGETDIIIDLHRPLSPYGMVHRKIGWGRLWDNKDALGHYKNFLSSLLHAIKPKGLVLSDERIVRELQEVIRFREALRKIISKTEKERGREMELEEFQTWYEKESVPSDSAKMKFLENVRSIYRIPAGTSSYDETQDSKVHVHQAYFAELAALLSDTSTKLLATHIHLYFLERHLTLSQELVKSQLEKSLVSSSDGNTDVIRYEPKRWEKCVKANNMKATLSKLFVKAHFSSNKKKALETLFVEAIQAMIHQIEKSNWLDIPSEEKAVRKVTQLDTIIGLQTSPWERMQKLHPFAVDMHYSHDINRLYLSAANAQYPIFSRDFPFVINYGSFVSAFGKKIYEAFDEEGVIGPKSGWWKELARSQHKRQLKCFQDQYKNGKIGQLKKRGVYNGTLVDTYNEDMTDVMGLKVAYLAYKRTLKENNGVCQVLPGFEDFTCHQLFFISYGNALCDGSTSAYKLRHLLNSEQSLAEMRVNGAVSNMKEFSDAFQCKLNDPLVPSKRCDLWIE